MVVRKKIITITIFSLIVVLSLLLPLVFMRTSNFSLASKLLSLATEEVTVGKQIYSLEALVSADGGFFIDPDNPPDPHIFAYIAVIAEDLEEFPVSVDAPKMWVIKVTDNCCEIPEELPESCEIWETNLKLASVNGNELIKNAFDGPIWQLNSLVHVIVQLTTSIGGTFLLKATNLRIVPFG